ncbi:hypothetical protein EYF80_007712 [Liparis tanakae]|uniref:Uncharacterized protein n=1 Tax=Liparis tanakae TaxID=230148 RepID=A0A4Z2IW04_9TELE|nr:hypothetical protein EYF80_007712 [Liparis tanakae]
MSLQHSGKHFLSRDVMSYRVDMRGHGLNLCPVVGESLMKLVCSGVQLVLCFSTGMGSDLGRNQKGMADMRVMVPAIR